MSDQELTSLRQQQAELAILLTNPNASAHGLSGTLSSIDGPQLIAHRETLIRKRLHQTAHMLPNTARALGVDFQNLFREFASTHHFNSVEAIRLDAIHFANWLSAKPMSIPWLACSLRLDKTHLDCQHRKGRYLKILRLEYALHQWQPMELEPNKEATVWVFLNSGSQKYVWHWP